MKHQEDTPQQKSPPVSEIPRSFFDIVNPYVDRLKEFVTRVMNFLEARGDLVQGQLTTDEVVDATLVNAYEEFRNNAMPRNVQGWLIRLATKQLATAVKRTQFERRRMVATEKDIPETPPAQDVSWLDEQIMDFYQPDEDLKLEDIIPEIQSSTPELEMQQRELRRCVRDTFQTMPSDWRRVLLLHYIQGHDLETLSAVMGKPKSDVERMLGHGREYLREKLLESGCTLEAVESEEGLRTTVEATSKKLGG